jgi:hypothetical protein
LVSEKIINSFIAQLKIDTNVTYTKKINENVAKQINENVAKQINENVAKKKFAATKGWLLIIRSKE